MGGRKVRAAARSKYRDEKDRASSWSAIFVGKQIYWPRGITAVTEHLLS